MKPKSPRLTRRLWISGLQYSGETTAQAQAREKACRDQDKATAAEEERIWKWKNTPWWEMANK